MNIVNSTINDQSAPPKAPGLPILGNGLEMAGDIQAFLLRRHQQHGPIFRVRALQQEFVVMAGLQANQFLRDQGNQVFTSIESMGGLAEEFNMMVHVLDGNPHSHLRSILGRALSPNALFEGWNRFVSVTEQRLETWQPGARLSVVDMFQRLTAEQLSTILGNYSSAQHFQQMRFIFELMLEATLAQKWPRAALKLPAYIQAKANVETFLGELVAERRKNPLPTGSPFDLIDIALSAVDEHGQPYSEEIKLGMIKQGYFAGINTVAYLCSFALYAVLKFPLVQEQVSAEVDALFKDGTPTIEQLQKSRILRNLIMEALRMYPPAPASIRTVTEGFRFHNYAVQPGDRVLIATGVPHFLPEHFPEPHTFNIERDNYYENIRLGAYAPFSLGTHTCLGQSLGQLQAMATLAILLHNLKFIMNPIDYDLQISASPGPHPDRRFRVKISLR